MTDEPEVRHVIYSKVRKITRQNENISGHKNPEGQTVIVTRDLGWFVLFDGSHEYIYFGEEQPAFKVGDIVKITFENQGSKNAKG